jgi:predicted nuclease with RNAse H fold
LRYIGIDLAWKLSPPKDSGTGYCIIDQSGLVLDLGTLTTDEEILERAGEDTWIGIDASLVVPSDKSIRGCERELRSLGMRILPTSRSFYEKHYGGCRGERLAQRLESMGFEYFGSGRKALFEVYPFAVLQTLSPGAPPVYKKGSRDARREASKALLRQLLEWEPSLQLPRSSFPLAVEGKGAADRMDALMAAVLLYRHGLYSGTRSLLVGDRDDGYILLPRGGGGAGR